jgi:hypothetical protein
MNRRRVGEDRGSKEMDGCPLTMLIDIHYTYRSALMHFQREFKHWHMHHFHHHTHCKLNSPVGTAPQVRGEMVGRW